MKSVRIIAVNTYREIIRDRILYGLIVFALLLIGLSLALGQLSFAEQTRISANFGLVAIHLSAVALSIFVGSTLVAKEIEKKTIMTLLVRPLSRFEFMLGKCMGLTLIIVTVIVGLTAILLLIFAGLGVEPSWALAAALYGILLESLILLACAVFFSTLTTPLMVVVSSVAIFLIGHWVRSLQYFAGRSDSWLFSSLGEGVARILPHFERLNWRSHVIYNDKVSWMEILTASGYTLAWFLFLMSAAALIFRRKDFG